MPGYFPIFKSVKTIKPVDIKPPPIKDEETSVNLHCMICYKCSHDLEFCNDINDNDVEQSSHLFENYVTLLCVQLIPSMQWNFRNEKLPFCNNCLMKVKNLGVLQNKLTFILKQIKKTVLDMKVQILKSQNNDSQSSTEGAEQVVEVEMISVATSKHQEKVDYFRRLVVKEFNPEVVLEKPACNASFDRKLKVGKSGKDDASAPTLCNDEFVESGPELSHSAGESMKKSTTVADGSLKGEEIAYGEGECNLKDKDETLSEKTIKNQNFRPGSTRNKEMNFHEMETILQKLIIVDDNITKSTSTEAQTHFRRIGNSHWQCKICKKRFITRQRQGGNSVPHFSRHFDEFHRNIKPYQCRLCSYRNYERYVCYRHIKAVHANDLDKMFWISSKKQQGNDIFSVDVDAIERNTSCAAKNGKPLVMNNKSTADLEGDDSMQKTQTAPAGKNAVYRQFFTRTNNHYKCKFCASKIMFRINLKRHFLNYHGPLEKFKCQYCQRIFASEKMHEKHILDHHDVTVTENNDIENKGATADLTLKSSTESRHDVPLQTSSMNRGRNGNELSKNQDKMDTEDSPSSFNDDVDSDQQTISVLSASSNIFEKSSPEFQNFSNDPQRKKRNDSWNSKELEQEGLGKASTNDKSNRRKSKFGKCDTRGHEYPPHIERGIINASGNDIKNVNEYFEGLSGDVNKVRCKVCSVILTKPKSHRHYILVHNKLVFRYKCKYCSKRFYYKSDCALHIRISHYMEKPYTCSHCPASFTTVNSRAIHRRKCSFLSSTTK